MLTLSLPGTPVNPSVGFGTSFPISELFVLNGRNLLQLTNFDRVDTVALFLSRDRRRAFFQASADPFGTNPTENCQLFSVDTLGSSMRQLTRFGQSERSSFGCFLFPPPGCPLGHTVQDP